MMDDKLTESGKSLINRLELNEKGFNIKTVVGLKKGSRLFFKKALVYDKLTFSHYFSHEYESGYQIQFNVIDSILVHIDGGLQWRNKKYETPENIAQINNLITLLNNQPI